MSEQLKPCPFCGASEAETIVDDGAHWTRCTQCGSTGPLGSKYSEDTDTNWNTRSLLAQRCTCPSGDGSLRWPCPVCPPDPVAWRVPVSGEWFYGTNEACERERAEYESTFTFEELEEEGREAPEPLYRHPPAQASVVLPKRKPYPGQSLYPDALEWAAACGEVSGRNACLDELKRLNPGITGAAPLRKS